MVNNINIEPSFAWCLPFILRKQNRIVSNLRMKYWHADHKFVIEVLKLMKQAYDIEDENGTEFWRKSIAKEMMKVKVDYVEEE